MTAWFRFWFLFSSFGPLYLIFAVKLAYNNGVPFWLQYVFYTMFGAAVIVFIIVARGLKTKNGLPFELTDVKAKDNEVFPYLMSYIPPLIARDMAQAEVYIPLLILYGIIFTGYMRLDSPYLNPFFIIFGYRIYEAKISSTKKVITILTRGGRIASSETAILYEIGVGDLYYCHR